MRKNEIKKGDISMNGMCAPVSKQQIWQVHHYVTKLWWRHQMETFPRHWPFARGIHRWPVNSSHKGQWRGAVMFSLICTWINGWVNDLEADDLRRHCTHYDVIVMIYSHHSQQDAQKSWTTQIIYRLPCSEQCFLISLSHLQQTEKNKQISINMAA